MYLNNYIYLYGMSRGDTSLILSGFYDVNPIDFISLIVIEDMICMISILFSTHFKAAQNDIHFIR